MMPTDPSNPAQDSSVGMTLKPRRLSQVISAALIAVGAILILSIATGDWQTAVVLGCVAGLLLTAIWLANHRKVELAAKMTVITLTLSMGVLSYLYEGINDAAVSAFPAILIFAAMFATRRFFIGLVATVILMMTVIVVLNLTGLHVNVVTTTKISSLFDVCAIMLATAYFVWKLATDLRRALQRLESENERIHEALTHIDILANNDALTGLPNRLLARARFEQFVELSKRSNDHIALLFIDLDNFKTVNDSLGHAAGDTLICEVANRLKSSVRASDTVSRQGGDEFLIMLAGQSDQESVATVAAKIIEIMSIPFRINSMEITATCSLGIALYPDNGNDFDSLLKHADMAMYKAKESGRNAFRFYDTQMNTNVIEHLHLISGIRAGLLKGEFKLHYQPQFDLKTGQIVGAEALIRWHNPELGNIPPNRFIPVAERSGQIHEIGSWVIAEACRQARKWQDNGLPDLVVAINLSPVQFRRDNIERDVINALNDSRIKASSIELELTESLLIVDSDHIKHLLRSIRSLGVHLSIDDFGTGYSNLGYLTRFEVERLKIDQSFIRRMTENKHDEGIVRAIIEMAHSLNLEVVAEGVENIDVLARLQELGCEFGQGYYWSPALPPDEFLRFVLDWRTKNNASDYAI
jgi:diguanylate cyclase (GGDEF)-like protein